MEQTGTRAAEGVATVHVENVGGIVEADVELRPGVNVLAGRNATNRTSFLRALMAALGSDDASLRGDAEEGLVELTIGEESYTRRLVRDGSVAMSGDPYLDDPTIADLFAFLLESNAARRAVAGGGDLREVVMRPVDTEAVEEEIDRLEAEKRDIESALEERGDVESRLAERREARADVDDRIEAVREELAAAWEAIEAADADLSKGREERAELDAKLSELTERRSEREEVRVRLEAEREALSQLREERSAVSAELSDAAGSPDEELEGLEARIGDLRERKRSLEATANQLQGIIQFNQRMIADEGATVAERPADAGTGDGPEEAVTDRLLPESAPIDCWTCGAETDREAIEETIEALRSRHRDLVEERRSVSAELEAAADRAGELRAAERRRAELRGERRRIEEAIEEAEETIDHLEDRLGELDAAVEELEAEVESREEEDLSAIVDLHAEANELEFEVDRLEAERDRIDERIEAAEERLSELGDLAERREAIKSDLKAARSRIERLEAEAVESFNEHAAEVLSVLGYRNVERIWLERKHEPGRADRGVSRGTFALHVVRTTEDGTAYEDTVEHLSESEREVTGLVFALAGYLVHDVHERVPFMLLDSLEAIDADRIAALIEYFAEHVTFLVVALLPGDAAAVDDRHRRIESI